MLRRFAAIFAGAVIASSSLVAPAASNVVYGLPPAPTITSVEFADGGFQVSWSVPETFAAVQPAVTHFVVSGGAEACPITVSATKTTALLPMLSEGTAEIKVQAVNAYGFSPVAAWSTPVEYVGRVNPNLKQAQILEFSDFHGAIETTSSNMGAALMAASFQNDRSKVDATFTVSVGDNIGAAPPISSQFNELPTILSLNNMGLDVSTFGNHEHDRNLTHLKKMIKASNAKWVVSNYSSTAGLYTSTAKAVKPYTLIKRGGVTIGVVGMNTPETPSVVFPGNLDYTIAGKKATIKISSSVVGANKAVKAAKAAGADFVIALVHEGWTANEAGVPQGRLLTLAKQLKGVAAVYGGHSHNEYVSIVGNVLTAQTKNAGVTYNRSAICVNTAKNKVLGTANTVVKRADVANFTPDAAAAATVAKYKAETAAKLDIKIGQMTNVAPRGGTPAVERSGEAALGSYIADAVRAKYATDLVLINGGGIRDTFPATTYVPSDTTLVRPADKNAQGTFDVVLGDAYTVLPFGNSVSIAEITGANLWAALENGVAGYPSAGAFPQISGFKFTFDPSLPAKSRVTAVTDLQGNPIAKDDTVYSIATVDFLVYGGDGYTQFDPSNVKVRDLLVQVFADAIKADALAGKPTVMATDGRITVVPAS